MDLSDEIDRLRARCIGCGKCSKVCPSLKHGGIDPMEVMMGGKADMSTCIGCGCCTEVCGRTDPAAVMKDIIAMERDIHVSQTFKDTGYAMPPAEQVPEPVWGDGDVVVMPGCVVKAKVPYVNYAASVAMKAMGIGASELKDNTCCMHPVQFREMSESERTSYNTAMGKSAGDKELVTLCGGCSYELGRSDVEAKHIIQFLYEHIDALPKFERTMKVAMEPGCSTKMLEDEMKAVLEAMNCQVVNTETGCCGKSTTVAAPLMDERQKECAGAEWIIVGCPMCLVKFDSYEGGIPTMHIAELVAAAAGDDRSLIMHRINGPDL